MEAYVHGVSTRKVDDLVAALGVASGISKSEVSRICTQLDTELEAFRNRQRWQAGASALQSNYTVVIPVRRPLSPRRSAVPSRKSPAQIRAELRRSQQNARRAVNKYNAGIRNVNQSIDRYNRGARLHNAKVRSNRARLKQELRRLEASQRSSSIRVQYRTSVSTFTRSFDRLAQQESSDPRVDTDILHLSEGEAANSVAALNALLDDSPATDATDAEVEELQETAVDRELAELDTDLEARWRGALFALHPSNPDAARHFCTSAREMLSDMLEVVAPAHFVEADDPACDRTEHGSITRRARIRFCLRRCGTYGPVLEDFVEEDITDVLVLFDEFNQGTHGSAGRFSLGQLGALKTRVEDAIRFILRIAA